MLLFSEPEDMAERLFGITEKLLIFADNDSEKRIMESCRRNMKRANMLAEIF